MRTRSFALTVIIAVAVAAAAPLAQEGFKFRTGVELINVNATVTDERGRFVSGLRREDFTIYENGTPQEVSHFSSDRVPVSLGILLDASGSMSEDKMASARAAINRLVFDLLGQEDELFFVQFSDRARVTQHWTTDRSAIRNAVQRVQPAGGTAMYDAVAESLPIAQQGRHLKKALLVISDGNDSDSLTSPAELRRLIRESEVLVYAIGVDALSRNSGGGSGGTIVRPPPTPLPIPRPFPRPGGRRPLFQFPPIFGGGASGSGERVNPDALRQMTDDTGGRTEIVRGFNNLDSATSRIADELSRQYYLGYSTTEEKDGRWHAIRVEVRNPRYTVRARRGYVAS
jgi:Ca-activated chloride channel family protein